MTRAFTVDDEKVTPEEYKPYSPGVVADGENLYRTEFEPENIQNGQLLPSAVSLEDLDYRGFSVDRVEHVDMHQTEERLLDKIDAKPQVRERSYIATLECRAIRAFSDLEGQRSFIVIDSAKAENKAHADIRSAVKRTDGQRRKLRGQLLPLMQATLTLFEGATKQASAQ